MAGAKERVGRAADAQTALARRGQDLGPGGRIDGEGPPGAADFDVVVAGSGSSGMFAAHVIECFATTRGYCPLSVILRRRSDLGVASTISSSRMNCSPASRAKGVTGASVTASSFPAARMLVSFLILHMFT